MMSVPITKDFDFNCSFEAQRGVGEMRKGVLFGLLLPYYDMCTMRYTRKSGRLQPVMGSSLFAISFRLSVFKHLKSSVCKSTWLG